MEWLASKDKSDQASEPPEGQPEEEPNFGALTKQEEEEKDILLAEGFGNWNRRDFNSFVKACEVHSWLRPVCQVHSSPILCEEVRPVGS